MSKPAKGDTAAETDAEKSVGDRVVAMRSEGESFAAIAKTIGVARSIEAFEVFVTAVAKRPARERAELRAQENRRLDALERRNAKTADEAQRTRRQAVLERLRARLIAVA